MLFFKHGLLVMIGVIGFVTISDAKQYGTEQMVTIQPVAELQLSDLLQRHCLYAGKAYSLGAIISTRNIELECRPISNIELNGALKWVVLQQTQKSTLSQNK
ncbi:DUF1496 domain-containing protein [Photobacterium kishitanii]|uniref:DUF1496 domain-containing protein n=1 Tax=Photobacterium kishitanii TaxID=318456 RepID=A0A0B7JHB8_9GAMM|nr:DUF1496 domain-containing protein [Photobacterium kishitanii]OBU23791.1 hypothetical protein AYY22_05455 [Photobacterium kishitanii]PSU91767.1 DUF1496 domain-containing protein [Photobacterium kishitanii]PSU93000.1 DUF1496 domain-containing protein [Photobacterium kishitanii]PSU95868.1 DUF1496 domain-containing protein [Photobacterium kishitanii]PSV12769.1 DUF1496 domain-containing protein [Photobacterium kishitanii]